VLLLVLPWLSICFTDRGYCHHYELLGFSILCWFLEEPSSLGCLSRLLIQILHLLVPFYFIGHVAPVCALWFAGTPVM
jgi:hypothetical protein